MADRIQFKNVIPIDPELAKALQGTGSAPATEEELHEQRISFAFGNALGADAITKETVRRASQQITLLSSEPERH